MLLIGNLSPHSMRYSKQTRMYWNGLKEIYPELKRQGNNLNQRAKKLNENGYVDYKQELPEKENRQERILDKIFLEELLNILGTEERRLICMRYFCDMTQTEVAKRLGISQVQVSRMEKRILHRLKKEIQDKTEV